MNDYVVQLRKLAKPCNFGTNLTQELLRACVFRCGIEKVEELVSAEDSKTLNDAVECGLKNQNKVEDLRQIRSAYTIEHASTGGVINQTSFQRAPTELASYTCGWCGREPHFSAICPAKDKSYKKCALAGRFASVCRTRVGLRQRTRTGKAKTVGSISFQTQTRAVTRGATLRVSRCHMGLIISQVIKHRAMTAAYTTSQAVEVKQGQREKPFYSPMKSSMNIRGT